MFIAILTYEKPLDEVDKYLAAHREFLTKHYRTGNRIAFGPQTPRVGGIILIKADDRKTIRPIVAQDPFFIHEIAGYQVVEFTPTMFCNEAWKETLP